MHSLLQKMKKNKKETVIFTLLMLLAVMLYILLLLNLPRISLSEMISHLLAPIANPISQWMQRGAS